MIQKCKIGNKFNHSIGKNLLSIEIQTMGCRLNFYESEVMRQAVESAGLDNTILINTCAVTTEAVRQARQKVRRARRENPDARIIVTGCAVQTEPVTFAKIAEADFVFGNFEKLQRKTYENLRQNGDENSERVVVNDIMSVTETAGHLIDGLKDRARAFVQIQNGCDHRCTFCIIPYGRGPSRSVPEAEVIIQIRKLVELGYREIVLTGVDITSYGADFSKKTSLGKLIQNILKQIPELERLRISSIDSVEVDKAFMEVLANESRLMPHLHLSIQNGDDLILKRMKRRHLRKDSIEFCEKVRKVRPDVVFGADLIAGFPTESDTMFENSLSLVDDCDLTYLHVFPFSPRPGTPAARMPQIDRSLVKERAQKMRQKGEIKLDQYLSKQVGQRQNILIEKSGLGRTEQFAQAEIGTGEPGEIISAEIVGYIPGRLLADGVLVG